MNKGSFFKNIKTGIRHRINKSLKNPYQKANLNYFKVKYLKHLPPGKLNSHILYGASTYFYNPQEFLHGIKEIFVDEIYKQQLPSDARVLDCGANIGLSVIYLKELYPDARITAFEPDEKNFELLSKNVAARSYKNIELRKEAIWIANTEIEFSEDASMSSRIEESGVTGVRKVKAIRLKDLLTDKVDFLKIDIEGAEFKVLSDIEEKLDVINNMFIEYHGLYNQQEELTQIFQILTRAGFNYYIKEAQAIYEHPFSKVKDPAIPYQIQLNIFCFRKQQVV